MVGVLSVGVDFLDESFNAYTFEVLGEFGPVFFDPWLDDGVAGELFPVFPRFE